MFRGARAQRAITLHTEVGSQGEAHKTKKPFQNFLERLFLLLETTRFPQLAKAGFTGLMDNDLHALLNQQFGMRT